MRIYGFLFQLRQLGNFSKMVRNYLLEVDRAEMTPEERAASIKREKMVSRRINRLMMRRLVGVFSPFYTPRKAREPLMFRSYMAELEAAL